MPILGVIASSKLTSSNSYESIQTIAATGSSITFSSIPSTYTHLQVRFVWYKAVSDQSLLITYNGVGGTSYAQHTLTAIGYGTPNSTGSSSRSNWETCYDGSNAGSATYEKVGIVDILDYANTGKTKNSRLFWGADYNGAGKIELVSSLFNSTNAITSITFAPFSTSFAAGSQFALYGIKG